MTALAVNPFAPYLLAVGCADSYVRIFDRRLLGTRALGNFVSATAANAVVTRFTVPDFDHKHHRITSMCYSADARDMLVSYSSDFIYLFDTHDKSAAPKCLTAECGTPRPTRASGMVRKLRVRGDWSDTGPNARPERERPPAPSSNDGEAEPTVAADRRASGRPGNLMQRMSEALTRIFNTPSGTPRGQTAQRPAAATVNDSNNNSSGACRSSLETPQVAVAAQDTSETDASACGVCDLAPIVVKQCDTNLCRPESSKSDRTNSPAGSATDESAVDSDPPSDSAVDDSDGRSSPGNKTFTKSLEQLEQQLTTRREQLLARTANEPVVNLQYSGEGVASGLITVEAAAASAAGSPASPASSISSSHSGFLSQPSGGVTDRPGSNLSDSLTVPGFIGSPSPGADSSLLVDGNQLWPGDELVDESVLSATTDDDAVTEEEDGRRSRRGNRDDEDEDETALLSPEPPEAPAQPPPKTPSTGRNPRELLLRSFDDVIKHFREEREHERRQLAAVGLPRVKQKYCGHRNSRTMVSLLLRPSHSEPRQHDALTPIDPTYVRSE